VTAPLETTTRRFHAPEKVFGGTWIHPCMKCGFSMRVRPNDGDIYECPRLNCHALHEYYMVLNPGSRQACVRLLDGEHRREQGEPKVTEFVE
jgi:hypothetical protein